METPTWEKMYWKLNDVTKQRIKALEDALNLAKLAWYGGHLPNDWYTTITKDYETKEFNGMTIGQVVSKLAAMEVKRE